MQHSRELSERLTWAERRCFLPTRGGGGGGSHFFFSFCWHTEQAIEKAPQHCEPLCNGLLTEQLSLHCQAIC